MNMVALGEFMPSRIPSINPAKHPEETFELWSIPAFDAGKPEILQGSEIGSSKKCVEPGDVLLARIVPHIRRSCVVTPNTKNRQIASGEWITFRGDAYDPDYLRHILVSDPFHAEFMQTVAGVGGSLLRARPESVKAIKIPLPPLEEQKRVAGILDQADALRRLRARALDKLNTLGQAIFHDMFGNFPDLKSLDDLAIKITDGTHQAPEWADKGVPFIFVSNVRDQKISLVTNKFVTEEEHDRLIRRTNLSEGDVVYTCVGSYGNAAVVDAEERFVFQRHIAHIKPNPKKIDPIFLSYGLEAPDLRAQADRTATGIAQKTVTLKALKNFQFPAPPLEEQRVFRKRVETLGAQLKEQIASLEKHDALFASLQHRAFRGEL